MSYKYHFNIIIGSYISWDISKDGEKPSNEPVTTYGPFPCKAIPKVLCQNLNGSPLIAFSGGLPRASYNDKSTVTLIHNTKHVVFDFTSKVFKVLSKIGTRNKFLLILGD